MDDDTASQVIPKGGECHAQAIADRVIQFTQEKRVHLNSDKCKELGISFFKEPVAFDPVVIEGKEIEVVSSVKLLGLTLASDLTWNDHITKVVKKAGKRFVFLN